jgi:hypothetical protein
VPPVGGEIVEDGTCAGVVCDAYKENAIKKNAIDEKNVLKLFLPLAVVHSMPVPLGMPCPAIGPIVESV